MSTPDEADSSALRPAADSPILPIAARCDAAHIPYTYADEDVIDEVYLIMKLPNGRSQRSVYVFDDNADAIAELDFEYFSFLGDYQAVANRKEHVIEAQVRFLDVSRARFLRLPIVERLEEPSDPESDDESASDTIERTPTRWRMLLDHGDIEIELSPPSRPSLFSSQVPTLKIRGITVGQHDAELDILEELSQSLFFDIDLLYQVPMDLLRRSAASPRFRSRLPDTPITFPKSSYPSEPVSLYLYGRGANRLPLLEFLAYYQSLEYFFPSHAKKDAIRRMRQLFRDPRFRIEEDFWIAKMLGTIEPAARGTSSEVDQLRAVLRDCLTETDCEDFIRSSELRIEHFCSKYQAIVGAPRIVLDRRDTDLRDQIAERIYYIRCRIVHTKHDGGARGAELLLPSSREARSLAPDIDIARIAAQKTLIANAGELHVAGA